MLHLLTFAAGGVDAVSYLGLEHVFTAMMTGNTVLLGLALGQGEIVAALRSVTALCGFALGVMVAAVIVARRPSSEEWPPSVTTALALEAIVLATAAVIWRFTGLERTAASVHTLIALFGTAMGMQAAAVRHLGVPGIATTYITGTVTSLFVDLVGWAKSQRSRTAEAVTAEPAGAEWERRVGLLAGVFVVYGLGALVGGVLHSRTSFLGALSPLIAVGVVVVNAGLRRGRAGSSAAG